MSQELERRPGDDPKTFFGWCFAIGGLAAGVVAGTVQGAYNALNGENFSDGFEKAVDDCVEMGTDFGDKHNDTIVQGAIAGVAGLAATAGIKKTFNIKG